MLRKTNIKVFILFFSLILVSSVGTLNQGDKLSVDNRNYNTINEKSLEKSSTYKITSLWNSSRSDIRNIEISQDGMYIVIGDGNNVTLFNKYNNDTLWSYDMLGAMTIYSLDISADGKYISAGNFDGNAFLINNTVATPYYTKKEMWNFTSPVKQMMRTAISSDGKYIVAANTQGSGKKIYLFNNSYQSGNKTAEWSHDFGGPNVNAIDIAYNPYDGHYYIAVGCDDNKLYLFNETQGQVWVNDTTASVNRVKISYDGEFILASNTPDYEVYLFNKTAQNPKKFLWNYTVGHYIADIDISGDGQYIVIGDYFMGPGSHSSIHYLNNTPSLSKQPIWEANATEGSVGENTLYFTELSGDGKYILAGTGISTTAHLYNSSKTSPKSSEWEGLQGTAVLEGAISWYGNYFVLEDSNTILHTYHHNVPLPRWTGAITGDDDDDDDDEDAAAIPFGNYYLIFTAITIISLVVIMKQKANFNEK